MPLKVKGLLFSFLTATLACGHASAQQLQANASVALDNAINKAAAATPVAATAPAAAPTLHDKLVKVRALIAARLLPTAAFELEKLKKETGDEAFQSAVRAMLVSVLLEQPNYERAKELLQETFEQGKNRKNSLENVYLPVAGQVIKSAYSQLERYKKFGFSLSDAKLPHEAATDLDRWRKLLETVCEQTKQMSLDDKRTAESLAILEAAAEARGALARDEYEARQWRNAMEDTREMIANAQTKVTDVDGATVDMKNVATVDLPQLIAPTVTANAEPSIQTQTAVVTKSSAPSTSAPLFQANTNAASAQTNTANVKTAVRTLSIVNPEPEVKTENLAATNKDSGSRTIVENAAAVPNQSVTVAKTESAVKAEAKPVAKPETKPAIQPVDKNDLLKVYALVDLATRKVNPNYPVMARTARIGGIVKVEVVVDEQGAVTEVKNSQGPELLRRAAIDAVRRWKFKPATRDGQAVRMTGFVNFNFAL